MPMASGPESLITPIAPTPGAVARATTVSKVSAMTGKKDSYRDPLVFPKSQF